MNRVKTECFSLLYSAFHLQHIVTRFGLRSLQVKSTVKLYARKLAKYCKGALSGTRERSVWCGGVAAEKLVKF